MRCLLVLEGDKIHGDLTNMVDLFLFKPCILPFSSRKNTLFHLFPKSSIFWDDNSPSMISGFFKTPTICFFHINQLTNNLLPSINFSKASGKCTESKDSLYWAPRVRCFLRWRMTKKGLEGGNENSKVQFCMNKYRKMRTHQKLSY